MKCGRNNLTVSCGCPVYLAQQGNGRFVFTRIESFFSIGVYIVRQVIFYSALVSGVSVGNNSATLFVQYLSYRKTFGLQLVDRADICMVRFLLTVGFKHFGTQQRPF
jgi:hypothetical protein